MITDTSRICREKREPLPTGSNYSLERYLPPLTGSVSGCLLRASVGQVQQIKADEMETSSLHPLPSSWSTQAGNFLISNLGSVQKEERERYILGGK